MASEFFDRVYRVVRLIPEGRVSTYGHIAHFLGTGRSARVVGYAMNASHNDPTVPAHRVVNRKGLLTGKNENSVATISKPRARFTSHCREEGNPSNIETVA